MLGLLATQLLAMAFYIKMPLLQAMQTELSQSYYYWRLIWHMICSEILCTFKRNNMRNLDIFWTMNCGSIKLQFLCSVHWSHLLFEPRLIYNQIGVLSFVLGPCGIHKFGQGTRRWPKNWPHCQLWKQTIYFRFNNLCKHLNFFLSLWL